MQPYLGTSFKHTRNADEAGLLRIDLVITVPDLLKFNEKLLHLKVFSEYRCGVTEFESPDDPATGDLLSKAGLRQPSGGVPPEAPSALEMSRSERSRKSPGGIGLNEHVVASRK